MLTTTPLFVPSRPILTTQPVSLVPVYTPVLSNPAKRPVLTPVHSRSIAYTSAPLGDEIGDVEETVPLALTSVPSMESEEGEMATTPLERVEIAKEHVLIDDPMLNLEIQTMVKLAATEAEPIILTLQNASKTHKWEATIPQASTNRFTSIQFEKTDTEPCILDVTQPIWLSFNLTHQTKSEMEGSEVTHVEEREMSFSVMAPPIGELSPAISSKEVSILVTMINDTMKGFYAKKGISVPATYLTVSFSEDDRTQAELRAVSLVLNHDPQQTVVEIPPGIVHVTASPALPAVTAANVLVHEDPELHAKIHTAIEAQFPGCILISPVNIDTSNANMTQLVHWHNLSYVAIAYAVIRLVFEHEDMAKIHHPSFLDAILTKDAVGRKIADEIIALYDKYYSSLSQEDGHQPFVGLSDFPSLFQVLLHATSLPPFGKFDKSSVLAFYQETMEKLTHMLSHTGSVFEPYSMPKMAEETDTGESPEEVKEKEELSYESSEELFARQFGEELPTLSQIPYSVFGHWNNSTENAILSAFLYRYHNDDEMPPRDIVRKQLQNMNPEIAISISALRNEEPSVPSIFDLGDGITSNLGSMLKFFQAFFQEVQGSQGAAAHMLSFLYRTGGRTDPNMAKFKHVGWNHYRGNGLDVIYAGGHVPSTNGTSVFYIPSVNFWGVLLDNQETFGSGLSSRVLEVIKGLHGSVIPHSEQFFHTQFPSNLPRSDFRRTLTDVAAPPASKDYMELFDPDAIYTCPFVSPVTGAFFYAKVRHDTDPISHLHVTISTDAQVEKELLHFDAVDDSGSFYLYRYSDGTIGEQVFFSRDYFSYLNMIFMRSDIILPVINEYQKIIKSIHQTAATSLREEVSQIASLIGQSVSVSSDSSPIGMGRGGGRGGWGHGGGRGAGFGSGFLTGALLAPAALGAYGLYGPRYYPYGYPYPPPYYPYIGHGIYEKQHAHPRFYVKPKGASKSKHIGTDFCKLAHEAAEHTKIRGHVPTEAQGRYFGWKCGEQRHH